MAYTALTRLIVSTVRPADYWPASAVDAIAFDKDTHRVRELSIIDPEGSPDLILLSSLRETPLFRQRRKLRWTFFDGSLRVIPLLHSFIREVDFTCYEDVEFRTPHAHAIVLRLLPSLVPDLEVLRSTGNTLPICS